MSDATRKQGASDASQNRGPRDPNSFTNDKDKKDYDTGYQQTKKGQ